MPDFLPLTPEIYQYIVSLGSEEPPVLSALRQESLDQTPSGHMLISRDQVQFLQFLIRLFSVKDIVEIGCFTGYSALAMAMALPEGGRVITCDDVSKHQDMALPFWQQAGMAHKIALHITPGTELLASLPDASADMIFIDADKRHYPDYYEAGLRVLRPRGVMLLDNMLSIGEVFNVDSERPNGKTVCLLNQTIHDDPRVENMMLNIGAGTMLVKKQHESIR